LRNMGHAIPLQIILNTKRLTFPIPQSESLLHEHSKAVLERFSLCLSKLFLYEPLLEAIPSEAFRVHDLDVQANRLSFEVNEHCLEGLELEFLATVRQGLKLELCRLGLVFLVPLQSLERLHG